MGLFDAIASSAANLTDNIVGMVNQNHQNKVDLRMTREQNLFNAKQAQIQRDWQQQMWGMNNDYNSPNAMISLCFFSLSFPENQPPIVCPSPMIPPAIAPAAVPIPGITLPIAALYRDWETDRKSTRLNSSHSAKSRMPSSA